MQLAFLIFEAALDSSHRGHLLNALRVDGVPGKFVRLLDDMKQRTTAAVRTPAGCTTPFEVVTGVRTVDQCPADIILAPSGRPLTDLNYADDVVLFAENSTKLQHVVNLVSKLAAGVILFEISNGIRGDGQPIELFYEFCYLGCMLENNGNYEDDIQQRCAKATSAFNSLTKCLWSTPITDEVKLRVYLSAIRPIMMYGSEIWTAPSTVMERLECTERKLFRRLLGYFWPRVCHNEDLYAKLMWKRADRLVQRVLGSWSGSSWKKAPGRKRKFWTEVVKEDMRTLGVDRQYRRDVKFRRIWHSDEWIDCVQALAEGCAELCSRTAHLNEDASNRVRR
ncbi:hypothetical protein RB195_023105 [Necator americanus]|uniref:Reverse transcriptase domain-containing protein n=1 Tax=Necator americanus TaxID=51031 RepID=A0ABR1EHV2_NECAM